MLVPLRWPRLLCLSLAAALVAGCATLPRAAAVPLTPAPTARRLPLATASPAVVVAVLAAAPSPTPGPDVPGNEGMQSTLAEFEGSVGDDPTGAKTLAFTTLRDFVNPSGVYASAWWLKNDGRADLSEVLAVILYTEGNTNFDVRTAVAARFLWYCGGEGSDCQGRALINFLSYFQPWRQPWAAPGFTSAHAEDQLDLGREVVEQSPGLLTVVIPGADTYVHSADGLSLAGSIDWGQTPFHFANVHSTWDSYLRTQLRRLPTGPSRLWVLTMSEASRVCRSQFICPDMTQPRP